jgi:hypothetical protein
LEAASRRESFLNLAIFIDGLDEYEGHHSDLAKFIHDFASPSVKIFASSRPINAVLHTFDGCPTLRLQHLTRSDMERYIYGNLTFHGVMVQLARHHPIISQEIFEELLEKAHGVFLWVSLVVKLLVDGLEAGDSIEDLQAKLHSLPSDLRDLYRRMMADIPRAYWPQSVEIFRCVQVWSSFTDDDLDAATLYFATRPPLEVMDLAIEPDEVFSWYCQRMSARLQSRSCGLLEY